MSGRTYTMHHQTEPFWEPPSPGTPRERIHWGQVLTATSFETTITIPDGMWVLEHGYSEADLGGHLYEEGPSNWIGCQKPRTINLGRRGSALYENILMICPEPFALLRGVRRGTKSNGRKYDVWDIHDAPFGLKVESARQIHKRELGRRIEVHDLPPAAWEPKPFKRKFAWVSVEAAMGATKLDPARLLLDYWPLVRYDGNLRSDATMSTLIGTYDRIHNQPVGEAMRQPVSFNDMELLVSQADTDWSRLWIPRGYVRDIMLLQQYNWHIAPRRTPVS
jgi:hypothetical protein